VFRAILAAFTIAALSFGFLLVPECRGEATPQPFRFPYPIKTAVLDNGLRLVMVPMPTPGVVTYETIVRAGSRNELEPGRTGYAHFFEHMMFRGTERFPGAQYEANLAMLGAEGNGSTGADMTAYYNTFPASGLSRVIEMEADRFQNLRYSEEEFRKEAGAVLGEFAIGQAEPETMMYDTLLAAAFHVHPYGHSDMGFERDVRAMPDGYDYSRRFYDRYYRPEYCAVLVTGDFDTTQVERTLRGAYSGWQRGGYLPEVPQEPPLRDSVRRHLKWNGPARPLLWISFRSPAFNDASPDAAALELIRELYFSDISELHRELVERKGMVESMRADYELTRDPRLFTVSARLKDPADFDTVAARILRTVREAAGQPLSVDRLSAARRHIVADLVLALETTGGAGWRVSDFISLTGDPRSLERYYTTMARITPQDVQAAALKWLDPRSCITLTMSGEERP
jgi:zinc protease